MGWFSRFRPEPGISMVFHTEAMTAVDEERAVAPYVCGPLAAESVKLWMPDTQLHQDSLAQVLDFMITRGRLTLPGVLLREPNTGRPNQMAVAAGGIRLGRLPDEAAAAVAAPAVALKSKGWLAVCSVSFVTSQDGDSAQPVDAGGLASADAGGRTIGCRVRLPDFASLAETTPPR